MFLIVYETVEEPKLWEDPWCSKLPLCLSFPALYVMVRSKNMMVGDLWIEDNWDFKFRRAFNAGKWRLLRSS